MDNGRRPGGSEVIERLDTRLGQAGNMDSLARILFDELTQPNGLCCVRRVALGIVQGAEQRLLLLASDGDVGAPDRAAAWTLVDSCAHLPLHQVARTGRPILGNRDHLAVTCSSLVPGTPPQREGLALAVVPLGRWAAVAAPGEPADVRPLGVLLLCYDESQAFGPDERRDLSRLTAVVDEALRRLLARGAEAADPVAVASAGPDEVVTTLPDDERAPGMARRFLRAQLSAWGVPDDDTATAELCLTELVTNAVIHGGGSPHVSVALVGEELEVRVRDRGPSMGELLPMPPAEPDADDLAVHGRGLVLIEALACTWGHERRRGGTHAWFRLALGETG